MQHLISIVVLLKQGRQLRAVSNINLMEFQIALRTKPFQILPDSVARQVVDDNNAMALFQIAAAGVTSDESSAPCYDGFHYSTLNAPITWS
jgi:hypothetical protein